MKQETPNIRAGSTDTAVVDLALKIMHYLEQHPHSKDTLDGIRTWWLSNDPAHIPISRVERAVDWLIRNHKVVREPLPDGGEVYSLKGINDDLKLKDH